MAVNMSACLPDPIVGFSNTIVAKYAQLLSSVLGQKFTRKSLKIGLLQENGKSILSRPQEDVFEDRYGQLAQLVRACDSHSQGHWFEPSIAHHSENSPRKSFTESEYFPIDQRHAPFADAVVPILHRAFPFFASYSHHRVSQSHFSVDTNVCAADTSRFPA